MPFLSRHYLEDEPFSKVLFYSVLIHYLFFFALFGNPFTILPPEKQGTSESGQHKPFSVNLLSLPGAEKGNKKSSSHSLHPTKRVDQETLLAPGERNLTGQDTPLPDKTEMTSGSKPLHLEALMAPLSASEEEGAAAFLKKKLLHRMPPSMTGPEDCMLKVVGMVCPGGEVGCIAAYKAFCASLPD